ncbi:MAG: ATP synthase F0 subunit C [Clostridia bacterium]
MPLLNILSLSAVSLKEISAAIVFAVVGIGCAIAMGVSISKAVEAMSRQPSADKKIRGALMLGLAFIETLAIYALLIAIMLIIL